MVPSNLSPQSGRGYTLSSGAEEISQVPSLHYSFLPWESQVFLSEDRSHIPLGKTLFPRREKGGDLPYALAGDSFSLLVTLAIFSLDFQSLANSMNELVPRAYCVLSNLMNTGRMKFV